MVKKFVLMLLPALQCVLGQDITRGPYLQMASDTSMTLRWRTSTSVAGQVCYGATPNNLDLQADEGTPSTDHEIKLTGLSPATQYFYSVGMSGVVLAGGDDDHHFTTSPSAGTASATRVWVIGDPGTGYPGQAAVQNAFHLFAAQRSPDLMLLLGDNAYDNGTDLEYESTFFNVYPQTLRQTPVWPTLGNHDTADSIDPNGNYPYFQIFTLPTNGEAGGVPSTREHYYSFDRGNAHFICLDSMTMDRSSTGAMATWLQNDLAACTKAWIIAYWHHPAYSKGSHDSDTELPLVEMRGNILPILEAGGVDLILNGHSHSYERSCLMDGHYGQSTTLAPAMKKDPGDGRVTGTGAYVKPARIPPPSHQGAVHVVAGSSGVIHLIGPLNHPAMVIGLFQLGSVVIDINGLRLDASFIQPTGEPLGSTYAIADSFTILKQPNPDSDGDGIPDTYETLHNLDPHDPADALLDADDDGISNLDEYLVETYPHRVLTHVDPQTKHTQLVFYAAVGSHYRVFSSDDLSLWNPRNPVIEGDDAAHAWSDDGSVFPHESKRFYRVEIAPATP